MICSFDILHFRTRSSATCEDLPDASFAGQHDTYLNISSKDISKYVVECFASLYTSRAISYRQRNDISTADMAVVVQVMVPNQVSSGVLFTANPLTGQRNEFVLEAIPGLGEALVSGLTEPDRYVVEMSKGEVCIKDKRVGSKKKVIHSVEGGGVKEEETTNNTEEILTDDDIKQIIQLGQIIQELYVQELYDGKPQDIEWAKANNGIIYIVQSRPITTLFPLPTSTEDDSSLQVLFSFNAVQGIVSPIYPMGQDVIRKCILGGLLRWITWDRYGHEGTFIQSVAERLYINITNPLRNSLGRTVLFKLLPSIEPGIMIALNKLLEDEPDMTINSGYSLLLIIRIISLALVIFPRVIFSVFFPNWSRKLAVWAVNNFVDDIEEKVDGATNLQDLVVLQREVLSTFFPMVVPTIAPRLAVGMVPLAILNKLASSLENGNDLVLTITRGLPHNCTTEMDLKLWQVAKTIQDDTESLNYFKTNDADTLARYYLCNGLPSVAQEAVTRFMNEYGVRGLYEIDFGRPRWREEPAPLMSSIKSYVQISQEHAPDKVFAAGEAAADAIRQLGQQLGKPWLVSFLARRTRSLAGIRELPKFTAIKAMGSLRAKLLQEGQRLVEKGVIDEKTNLFYLYLDELESLAIDELPDCKDIISERKATMKVESERTHLPRVIATNGYAYFGGSVVSASSSDKVLCGEPVSPGVYEGRVRIVHEPSKANLCQGEVLVCHGTDPSWTPLFLSAGALVMEVGGLMTHGSVVAREYGIPAVVGLEKVAERLVEGQMVRVDGSNGTVEIIDEGDSSD